MRRWWCGSTRITETGLAARNRRAGFPALVASVSRDEARLRGTWPALDGRRRPAPARRGRAACSTRRLTRSIVRRVLPHCARGPAVPATWRAAPQPSPADRRRCRPRASCTCRLPSWSVPRCGSISGMAAANRRAGGARGRARAAGRGRRGRSPRRAAGAAALRRAVAAATASTRELHQARVVGTGAQQRIDSRQRLLVITGGIAGRRELEGQRGISRRQLQRGGQFRHRVLLPILGAGDRGAGRAPLRRVGERVEMRVRRALPARARYARPPVARFGIRSDRRPPRGRLDIVPRETRRAPCGSRHASPRAHPRVRSRRGPRRVRRIARRSGRPTRGSSPSTAAAPRSDR